MSEQLFNKQIQSAMVFAARYTHHRATSGTLEVCCALESIWHQLSKQTQDQILRESQEATCNRDEWERFRVFANDWDRRRAIEASHA